VKIAQVAPLIESVPPAQYGGTERVVSYLTEELIAQGHQITLFASGDSETAAELVACCPKALRRCPDSPDPLACQFMSNERLAFHCEPRRKASGSMLPPRPHQACDLLPHSASERSVVHILSGFAREIQAEGVFAGHGAEQIRARALQVLK